MMRKFFKQEEKPPFTYPAIEERRTSSNYLGWIVDVIVVDDHLTASGDCYIHQLFGLPVLVNCLPFKEEVAWFCPFELVGHLGNVNPEDVLWSVRNFSDTGRIASGVV